MSEERKRMNAADPLADVVGAVDVKLEEEGEWFKHADLSRAETAPDEIDGFRHLLLDAEGNGLRRVKVRSKHSKAFKADARNVQLRSMRMPQKQRGEFEDNATNELIAKHCLMDWDFTNRLGQPVPFDQALAERVMREEKFRHHRNFIAMALAAHEGVIARTLQDDSGN